MKHRLITIGTYSAALVALLDQFSKLWILHRVMVPKPHVVMVNDFLNFVMNWNRGVTFGMFNRDSDYGAYLFAGIAGLILILLFSWLWRAPNVLSALGLGLVIGGAIGNIIDRIRYGAVLDFIDFHINTYHWYVFNLADSAIVGGVCLLMIEHLVTKPKKG